MHTLVKATRRWLFLLFTIGTTYPVIAAAPDSLRIKKGEIIFYNDSIVSFDHDTVITPPPGVAVFRTNDNMRTTKEFYDSLLNKNEKQKWVQRLFNLLIVTDRSSPAQEKDKEENGTSFMDYEGYVIQHIKVFSLDPFGPVARDTILNDPGGLQHTLNLAHIKTRERVIRQNLLIHEGERIEPSLLSDNERILRHLPFIKDARIIIIPLKENQADLLIITRDVFSLAFSYNYAQPTAGNFSVYENNFLGYGHQLKINGLYDFDNPDPWGWSGSYRVDHIGKSFISGNIEFYSAFGQHQAALSFNRDFISPFIRNAGGVNTKVAYVHERLPEDTIIRPLRYFYHDIWFGHSFLLNPEKRNRFIVSGRYYLNNVMERPEIKPFEYHRLQRYQLILGSISYSFDHYLKSGLIYNFGVTEDIPKGMKVSFLGGYEWNEFNNRPYIGTNLSMGIFSGKSGYLNSSVRYGGYLNQGAIQQGVFRISSEYFSPLVQVGNFFLRQFVNADFTMGIRRFIDEGLTLNNDLGIRGFKSDSLYGTRRLAVQLETVAFSPLFIYGFRFTFFTFADLGIIDSGDLLFTQNKLYSGIGLGVRIRNENLVFRTFQIRLAYYPVLPQEASYQTLVFSGEKLFEPMNFNGEKPDIERYY